MYLNETYKLEQTHIYKIESLVVLQSIVKGLTRVQTVKSTFCKRKHIHIVLQYNSVVTSKLFFEWNSD